MIGNPNDNNEENRQELQAFTNQSGDVVPSSQPNKENPPNVVSSDNPHIVRTAQMQAIDDIEQIKELQEIGNFVVIDWLRVGKRASSLGGRDVREYYKQSGPNLRDDYKQLLEMYKRSYEVALRRELAELRQDLGDKQEGISYLNDIHEVHLREAAIQDKKSFSSYGSSLVRDLAVIRAITEFGIAVDQVPDHLQGLHPYVEKYQSYYINPGKEEVWPGQENFRS
jgi:hypothetical protein